MSLEYYLEVEDIVNPSDLLLDIIGYKGEFRRINGVSVQDENCDLIIDIIRRDSLDRFDSEEYIKEVFGFTPQTLILFTHSKKNLEENEELMMLVFLFIINKIKGSTIFGFSEADKPFIQTNNENLFIDHDWENTISKHAFGLLINTKHKIAYDNLSNL